eukprot:TRINITY_DN9202_c1_g1_i4.p1 TRINITY_DN9202_c1_g1~~TRINITY_DN9202_c1_g1_i4.p1  ORF type:complete len:349 (-),score=94.66 TRINITY_DN9202_c1_g1_i4:103-1098(-)
MRYVPWKRDSNLPPEVHVVTLPFECLYDVSSCKVHLAKDLSTVEKRAPIHGLLLELEKRFPKGIPKLHPKEDLKVNDPVFDSLMEKVTTLEEKLKSTPEFQNVDQQEFSKYQLKMKYEGLIRDLKRKIRMTDEVILKEDLKCMKRVLRRLGYLTSDNVVDVKGRVACEVNASDELVLTEMLFSGFFTNLKSDQIPAILSCFVFDEKSSLNVTVMPELAGPYRELQDIARKVAEITKECKLPIDVEEYVGKFQPELIEVVYQWCKGANFSTICGMTSIFEGSIIRGMRRLEELLRQLVQAAKTIGDSELENNIAEGISLLKRDIVFAASLYL